jgi:hypothetical protein
MSDPAQIPETSGGSGMTHNAWAALDSIITQLEVSSNGTDPAIGPLRELANRGKKIRDIQALIESTFPPEGFPDAGARSQFLRSHNITLDGQTVSLQSALDKLSAFGIDSTSFYSFDPNTNETPPQAERIRESYNNLMSNGVSDGSMLSQGQNPYLYDFMMQYQQVKNLGLLADPTLNDLITNVLAKQIYVSSMSTKHAGAKTELVNLVNVTGTGANGICQLSNATDCNG